MNPIYEPKARAKEYGDLAINIDKFKICKLNYHPPGINWKAFGEAVEAACKRYGRNYYIKEDLRKEMQKDEH